MARVSGVAEADSEVPRTRAYGCGARVREWRGEAGRGITAATETRHKYGKEIKTKKLLAELHMTAEQSRSRVAVAGDASVPLIMDEWGGDTGYKSRYR